MLKGLVAVLLVILTACAGSRTHFDFDPNYIFPRQLTYAFTQSARPLSLDRQRWRTALQQALADKGWVQVESSEAELLLNLEETRQQGYQVRQLPGQSLLTGHDHELFWQSYQRQGMRLTVVSATHQRVIWEGEVSQHEGEKGQPEERRDEVRRLAQGLVQYLPSR